MTTTANHQTSQDKIIPKRIRPFEGTQLKLNPFIRRMMGRDPCPNREEYDLMVDSLMQGDEPMDKLLDWLYDYGPKEGRALYMKAVEQGISSIPNAPQPLKDFFALVDTAPAWLDRSLLAQGVRFIHRTGLVGPYVLRDFALMAGYLLSGFNHALVMTGALNKGAAQRIAETGKWWIDCTESGGMERFGNGFQTTLKVRLVHAMVRRHLPTRPEWDIHQWGLPVNQTDMLATYLAFGPVMMVGMRAMGIPITKDESRAVMHLWKYAGWLMGVEERWLVDSEQAGLVRLFQTFLTQSQSDWTSKELGKALSEEPLERTQAWVHALPWSDMIEKLLNQFEYHKHLSNSSLFLNRKQMVRLGLPENILPWYPLLMMGPRFALYMGQRYSPLPILRKGQEKRGREQQLAAMKSMWGEQEQRIIQPGDTHPAHV